MNDERWTTTSSAESRIRSELRVTLAAYHELGPEYEDQVINSFVDRIRPVLRPAEPAAVTGWEYRRGRGRRRPGAGLLIALALLFGWFLLSSPVFGAAHRYRYYHGGPSVGRFPSELPGISAPSAPAAPQPRPGASVQ